MLVKTLIQNMQKRPGSFINAAKESFNANYESCIKALNGLQSNADYIKHARTAVLTEEERYSKTILLTQKYLIRSGITLKTLDTLPVIHVAGTKGKGSTCALCESILREHGLKTGFYSSPHLLEVRERIRINGLILHKAEFVKHFWAVYNKLEAHKDSISDMPMYFQFLTILAFRIFLLEKVDVAIIEVGIGGEYDSTNILRNVPIIGITSLGIDHTSMLGNSIEKIAWHKAGIMKPGSQVFTVPQPESAMKVLKNRSIERHCSLKVVKPIAKYFDRNSIEEPNNIFNLNVNMALALAEVWMNLKASNCHKYINSVATNKAIAQHHWPGRYQILKGTRNTYYLDGAHTPESIKICVEWFKDKTKQSVHKKVLIFNATGDRNSQDLMKNLKACNFDKVFFVPNIGYSGDTEDNKNFNITDNQQLARCYNHFSIWNALQSSDYVYHKSESSEVMPSVLDAVKRCNFLKCDILITGSLHLIGAFLSMANLNNYSNEL